MQNLVQIGSLRSTHGLKGELKLHVEDAYIEDLSQAQAVFIAIAQQKLPYFVESIRSGGTIIKLEEVDDLETAATLQKAALFLPADQLSAPEEEEDGLSAWNGFIIEDQDGRHIGPIVQAVELPQQVLAEVEFEGKIIMVPLHEDLIISIDPEQQLIRMSLPDGLLEL